MEQFFKPLLIKAGGTLDTEDAGLIEKLRRLDHLHFLTKFGARVWTGIHATNWRHREAAAKATLHFIEVALVIFPAWILSVKARKISKGQAK